MKLLQEKLEFLLDKYSVEGKVKLNCKCCAEVDGKCVPLLSHRSERRFIELKNIVNGGTLKNVSVMRVARIVENTVDIEDELYRELDICQWVLQDKFIRVTAVENGKTLNIIATTAKGIVCTIEISATLKAGARAIDKHEIISERGTACDVVVDAQIKQDSIYVYADEDKKYTDVDAELYGLEIDDIAVVRAAFGIAQKNLSDEYIAADEELEKLVEAVKTSAKTGERVVL